MKNEKKWPSEKKKTKLKNVPKKNPLLILWTQKGDFNDAGKERMADELKHLKKKEIKWEKNKWYEKKVELKHKLKRTTSTLIL